VEHVTAADKMVTIMLILPMSTMTTMMMTSLSFPQTRT
jgi:hypothetical protein